MKKLIRGMKKTHVPKRIAMVLMALLMVFSTMDMSKMVAFAATTTVLEGTDHGDNWNINEATKAAIKATSTTGNYELLGKWMFGTNKIGTDSDGDHVETCHSGKGSGKGSVQIDVTKYTKVCIYGYGMGSAAEDESGEFSIWYKVGDNAAVRLAGYSGFDSTTSGKYHSATNTVCDISVVGEDTLTVWTAYSWDDGVAYGRFAVSAGGTDTKPEPIITSNLSNQTVDVGSTASFSLGTSNVSSYRWYKNGTEVSGATGSTYSFSASASDHNASIYCVASGDGGSVTSNTVRCYINPPSSTNGNLPASKSVTEGDSASFSASYKNAKSVQWQKSTNNGSSFENIAGATGDTYTINNVTRDMNGIMYRLRLDGVNGGTAYACGTNGKGAILSVAEGQPAFLNPPCDSSTIEGRNASFTATGNQFAKSYQWQYKLPGQSAYTNFADSSSYVDGQIYVAGSKSSILNLSSVPLSYDKASIRCKITNVSKSTNADAVLNVASKQLTGFKISYPFTTVDYGTTVKISDVYVFLKYDSGDADFGRNFSGLTFDDGTTEKVMSALGNKTLTAKLELDGKSYTSSFSVDVEDTSAPVIGDVVATWTDTNEVLDGINLTNDLSRTVHLEATATDNYDSAEHLTYEWFYGNDVISTANSVNITNLEYGNGTYVLKVTDSTGHVSDKTYELVAWDNVKPTISNLVVSPNTNWSVYRSVEINASDDVALAIAPYSFDDGATWVTSSTKVFTENGHYTFMVRDKSGNTASAELDIDSIDRDYPEIVSTERSVDTDRDMVLMTIVGTDATSNVQYGYDSESGLVWNDTGVFDVIKNEELDLAGRSFYVRDEAGNQASVKLYLNSRPNNVVELQDVLNASLYQENTDWVNAETGTVIGCALPEEILANDIYPSYKWSDTNVEQSEPTTTVHENGDYTVTVYARKASGSADYDLPITSTPITVNNVDGTAPEMSEADITRDGTTFTVAAHDTQSGIRKVTITGGDYNTETVMFENAENACDNEESCTAEVHINTTYTFKITDAVGNVTTLTNSVTGLPAITPTQVGITLNPISWTKQEVLVEASIDNDAKQMLSGAPYKWSNTATFSPESATKVQENGNVSLTLADRWGNTYNDLANAEVKNIDKEVPSVVLAQAGTALWMYTKDESSGIKSIHLIHNDTGTTTEIYNDSTAAQGRNELDKAAVLCRNGSYSVIAYDVAGNGAKANLTAAGVPEITPSLLKAYINQSPTEYTRGNVTLSVALPSEYNAQLSSEPYAWSANGGTTWTTAPYLQVKENGTYYARVNLADGSQVVSEAKKVENIDNSAPRIEISVNNSGRATISLKDYISGLSSLTYSLSGGGNHTITYGNGVMDATENLNLTSNGTYLFTVTDNAGNTTTAQKTISGRKLSTSMIDAWLSVKHKTNDSAMIYCTVPADCWSLLVERPFLWSNDDDSYTNQNYTYVYQNGTYHVKVKGTDGKTYRSSDIKIDHIKSSSSTTGNGGGNGGGTPWTDIIVSGTSSSSSSRKDVSIPNLSLTEENHKIIISASDDGGIKKISWKGKDFSETDLTTPNGSTRIKLSVIPTANGEYTVFAYDMSGNKAKAKINIADITAALTDVSKKEILPEITLSRGTDRVDANGNVEVLEDSKNRNTVSDDSVNVNINNGGKQTFFDSVPTWIKVLAGLLLILLLIVLLGYLIWKYQHQDEEEKVEDSEEEEELVEVDDNGNPIPAREESEEDDEAEEMDSPLNCEDLTKEK